jgi:uncharacterized protein YggE
VPERPSTPPSPPERTRRPARSSTRAYLHRRALRAAFADARAKAQTLAEEAGAGLGAVRRIDATTPLPPQPVYQNTYLADAARTPIEPGTEETQATVTVTFSLA